MLSTIENRLKWLLALLKPASCLCLPPKQEVAGSNPAVSIYILLNVLPRSTVGVSLSKNKLSPYFGEKVSPVLH